MKKMLIAIGVICILLLVGCGQKPAILENNDPKEDALILCPQDAKQCPDGSFVGRDNNNNCEFRPCPPPKKIAAEFRKYVENDAEQCKMVLFQCIEGAEPFFDQSGCGCEAVEPKKYVSQDLGQCELIKYQCEKNYVPFSDEVGCGCKFSWENVDS